MKLFLLNILDKTEETSVAHIRNQRGIMEVIGGYHYYLLDSYRALSLGPETFS